MIKNRIFKFSFHIIASRVLNIFKSFRKGIGCSVPLNFYLSEKRKSITTFKLYTENVCF